MIFVLLFETIAFIERLINGNFSIQFSEFEEESLMKEI